MLVNNEKSKIMIFRKGRRLSQSVKFYFGDILLGVVNKFSYLGIPFTSGGSFVDATNTLSGQSMKAIFKLNKLIYNFPGISVEHRLNLFDKLILPIINCGAEIWGFHTGDCIEKVHLQFCKPLLSVKRSSKNDFVYGELGRHDLYTGRLYIIIKFWLKIMAADQHKLVKLMYTQLYFACCNNNHENWVSKLRNLLNELGFGEAWVYQGVGHNGNFLSLVKQRLRDNYIQLWENRLSNSPRARFYLTFRNFEFQTYLNLPLDKYRFALSRLRVSSHRLQVEVGRWHKPKPIPVQERKCIKCNTLEDEFHFILVCPHFDELRKDILPKYFWNNPNRTKLSMLFSSEQLSLNRMLATFVQKAFMARDDLYYVHTLK